MMPGLDSYTKLLIHSDTTDGSTVFSDSSFVGRTITPSGTVHHETDQQKFGATSIYFNGSSYLTCGTSADFGFGAGDFTIDFWVFLTSLSGNQYIIDLDANGGTITYNAGLRFYNLSTGLGSPLYTTVPAITVNE